MEIQLFLVFLLWLDVCILGIAHSPHPCQALEILWICNMIFGIDTNGVDIFFHLRLHQSLARTGLYLWNGCHPEDFQIRQHPLYLCNVNKKDNAYYISILKRV